MFDNVAPMYPDTEDTKRLKQAFAIALLKTPNDSYGAAKTIESHPGRASWIAMNWTFAEDVLEFMTLAQTALGARSRLPSQDEFAAVLYSDAAKIADNEIKLKYYKLFADVMGYISKEGSTNINTNLTINKVMAYPIASSPEAWEAHAIKQQATLLSEATVIEHDTALRA